MIYHNVAMTRAEDVRLARVRKVLLEYAAPGTRERKFITKANLRRLFILQGLDEMQAGGVIKAEIIDLLVAFGRAKGRPNGRR